jgi:YHS domain-containing protein
MRTISLSALVLALSSFAVACGGSTPAPSTPAAAAAAAPASIKPIGEAKVGDTSKCPVSGEEFVVAADSPKVDYEGKTYYFCCGGCAKKFSADPKKFLNKPAT